MPEEFIRDTVTQLTVRGIAEAFRAELPDMPSRGVLLLTAHVHLETGLRACHCWNLGNAKWSAGYDFTMFECGEEVTTELANATRQQHPGLVTFVGSPYVRGSRLMQSVRVKPPHPWTRFRAFRSLQQGAADHIKLLRTEHYTPAWYAVAAGEPIAYARALASCGYFTADPGQYARTLAQRLRMVRGSLMGRPTLRPGGSPPPDVVREVQGIIECAPSGRYDTETVACARRWQGRHGLGVDGIWGNECWATAYPDLEVLQ